MILYIGLDVIIDSSNEKIIELKKKNDRVIMVMIILDIYFFASSLIFLNDNMT